jgi:hypothetical protein
MSTLSQLSSKLGQPKAQIIELALKDLEERLFWADVHRVFEVTAIDPELSAQQKSEFEIWDRVSNSDLKDEAW